MYSNTYTQMDAKDILPDIIIDDSADDYVETDEESEDEPEPPKSRPPASEIFAGQPTIQVEVESEEEETAEPQPVAQLEIQPIAKPKRQASSKQKEHLARIRVKAAESRRQKAAQKKQSAVHSAPHPTFSETDVDRLLDRYKERRNAKKPKPKRNEDSLRAATPAANERNADSSDLHTVPAPDDPWAECFL